MIGRKKDKVDLKLKVGELTSRDEYGKGIARIDSKIMKKLGIKEGDIIEIEGKNKTGVIAVRPYPNDIGLDIIRIDGLVRRNVGAGIGDLIKVRKADASINKPAHGYVLDDVSAGSDVTVYFNGFNDKLSGLTVGKYYFLSNTTPGKVIDTAPITYLKQRLGFAISSNTINVIIEPSVELGYVGIFGGGYDGSARINTIDYVTISTPGNATDFGDLTVARNRLAATSNA